MQHVSMKKVPDSGGSHGAEPADAAGDAPLIESIKGKINQFNARHGRRPRVLVSAIGLRYQKRSLNQAAAIFARWGFDVDIGPICQSPHQVARMAIENDVHMVCLLGDADQQAQVGSDLMSVLRDSDSGDILVAVFCENDTGVNRCTASSGRSDPFRFRCAAAGTDILSILDKLIQKN